MALPLISTALRISGVAQTLQGLRRLLIVLSMENKPTSTLLLKELLGSKTPHMAIEKAKFSLSRLKRGKSKEELSRMRPLFSQIEKDISATDMSLIEKGSRPRGSLYKEYTEPKLTPGPHTGQFIPWGWGPEPASHAGYGVATRRAAGLLPPISEGVGGGTGFIPKDAAQQLRMIGAEGFPVGKGLQRLRYLLETLVKTGHPERAAALLRSPNLTQMVKEAKSSTDFMALNLLKKVRSGEASKFKDYAEDTGGILDDIYEDIDKTLMGARRAKRARVMGQEMLEQGISGGPPERGILGGKYLGIDNFGAIGGAAGLGGMGLLGALFGANSDVTAGDL